LTAAFSSAKGSAKVTAYVDTTTHNGRWVQEETSIAKLPKLVISMPKGEEKATFADSDFTIKGCTALEANVEPELMVDIWN
jgi:hypothetical protein